MLVEHMYNSETIEDKRSYYYTANNVKFELYYLLDLEKNTQHRYYNKAVTPGDDDRIVDLVEKLREAVEYQELDEEWLESNSEDLEKTLQLLMADQEWMDDDLADTKKMVRTQLDKQKKFIESLKLQDA